MKTKTNNSEAVSPVIGVILMVAITVILAAVIAAFVFGMAGSIQKTKIASATLTRPNSSAVIATFQGGQDAAAVTNITWTTEAGSYAQGGMTVTLPIGNTKSFPAALNSHIVGIAYFNDGSQQVILEATL